MSDVRSDLTEYMYDPFTIQGLELSIPKEDESTWATYKSCRVKCL